MMHGHEKSDLFFFNDTATTEIYTPSLHDALPISNAAEPVERRAGTKGNAGQQSTCRTQSRTGVSQALERIRHHIVDVTHPRGEPYAGETHVRIWAGGVR